MPVGSSARRIRGALASARQKATRCCSPPESAAGRWPARSAMPTVSSSDRARVRAAPCPAPLASCGRTMFSSAENSGSRWWNW
ncbi:hypothetical protein OB2597_15385 [Pseudooceanicola batsensis HTCC2597]|uniref:Uncharacterized protein n=1 Tax=Pseudooceanicola batsensis (strain ATCC BAA-863 / DSM 15984 / KCTC 12145 / HTCC2597) TaxID=252305 RepID=A3TYV9_PSEBH|nr:hypothetical protein OB2597_15385 [Pseudooceanicola batsensis HTCC2597]